MQSTDVAALLRLLLMLAYPFLAQAASMRESGTLAAIAALDMLAFLWAEPLVRRRAWAWLGFIGAIAGAVWLAGSRWALLPLLLAPPLFMAMIAWLFARTLLRRRVPLITRLVAALDGSTPQTLEPELYRYSHRLTGLWAVALAVLALFNLGLAMIATPRGILPTLGIQPAITVTDAQWSWFANWINYGLVGLIFLAEFIYRKRRFPGRYKSLLDFGRKVAGLGPAFWRDLLK